MTKSGRHGPYSVSVSKSGFTRLHVTVASSRRKIARVFLSVPKAGRSALDSTGIGQFMTTIGWAWPASQAQADAPSSRPTTPMNEKGRAHPVATDRGPCS